jgi:uncharacterized phage protein (TIGR01671 family)
MYSVTSIDFSKKEISGVMDRQAEEVIPWDACELMQYTGLRDMKGQPICEGDIVDDTHGRIGIQQSTRVVRWNEEEVGFGLYDSRNRQIWWKPHLFEVIGNIYEHRSLLSRDR